MGFYLAEDISFYTPVHKRPIKFTFSKNGMNKELRPSFVMPSPVK